MFEFKEIANYNQMRKPANCSKKKYKTLEERIAFH